MQSVIYKMNEIQKVLSGADLEYKIDLPSIAVVGSQSSGKSSVLEAIVGEDFLPRGPGITTRCPLKLQLINDSSYDNKVAVFGHLPKYEIADFTQVRTEIMQKTLKLTGNKKDISSTPIILTIRSKDVPNLTLIDLPGLVKLQTDEQTSNQAKHIEKLVMEYIEPENTIILATTPANGDITTSDGLACAKKVDPDKKRTF